MGRHASVLLATADGQRALDESFNSQSCECATSDLNDDDSVELADFVLFADEYTGALACGTGGAGEGASGGMNPGCEGCPLNEGCLEALADWTRAVIPEPWWRDLAEVCLEVAADEPGSARATLHATFAELLLADEPQ